MPMLRIETNQTRCHVPKDFHKTTTELIARLLEKPAERCCVTVVTDMNMSRGGCTEPCGFAELICIGQIDEERNKSYAHVISGHLEKFLGISRKRLLIHFIDEKPENLGNCGTTYKELLQEYKPKKKKKQRGSSSESGSSGSDSDDDKKKKGKKGKKGRKESVDSKGKRKGSVSSGKSNQSKEADKKEPGEGDTPDGGEPPDGEPADGEPADGGEGGEGGEGSEGGEGGEGGEGEEEEEPAE